MCLLMVNLGAVSDEPKMQATEHKHEGHMNHEEQQKFRSPPGCSKGYRQIKADIRAPNI